MKIKDRIFVFGAAPKKNSPILKEFPHPLDKNQTVRFVKDFDNGKLYFNFKDFLKPYPDKRYEKVVLKLIPFGHRNLNKVWMSVDAWAEIKKGIDTNTEEEVIAEWKERYLF